MQSSNLATQGKSLGYGYDALNRLISVTHPDGAITHFGYDAVGNRQSVTRVNASGTTFSTTTYTYDALNRLTDLVNRNGANAVVSDYLYQLRADGKRSGVTETGPGTSGSQTTYAYDDAGRLTQESGAYATVAYTYDAVGKRLTKTVSGSATPASAYDANDRLTSGAHSYDADGNELNVNGQAAVYDFENHLIGLSGSTSYTYDADGNRVGVTSSTSGTTSSTTSYLVDTSLPYASVVEEYSDGSLTARYDYGDDLVRMDRAGGIYYYLYDGLGSTQQLVSAAGAVTDRYGYDAFGIPSHTSGSALNPFQFNGQQYDGALGLYFLRARYYAPTEGRFLSQDPYSGSNEDPITLHRYLYAGNDSINNSDPGGNDFSLGGLTTSIAVGATIGAIANGASEYALTGHVGIRSILVGAALGGALAPAAAASPAIATILGLIGVGSSSGLVYKVFTDPMASAGQKYAAAILLVASIAGTGASGRQAVQALQNQEQISSLIAADDVGDSAIGPGTDLVPTVPPDHGFSGEHGYEPLPVGKVVGRFGSEYGSYLTDPGTPEQMLSLPPNAGPRDYSEYVVTTPFFADSGNVAAYYGLPGGGRQYYIGGGYGSIPNNANPSGERGEEISVEKLIEWGYLSRKK